MGRGGSDARPTWWVPVVLGLLLVALITLVERLVPGVSLREILDVALVVAMFGLMAAWAWHNRVAIELEAWQAHKRPGRPPVPPPGGGEEA